MKLKQTLGRILKEKKITTDALGKQTGVKNSTIKTWLRGSNPRSMDDVRKVARHLNVSLEFLLFGEDDVVPRSLEELLTENVYEGWLKVKIERAVKIK